MSNNLNIFGHDRPVLEYWVMLAIIAGASLRKQLGSVLTSVSEVCRLQGCGAKLDKYFHFNHWL